MLRASLLMKSRYPPPAAFVSAAQSTGINVNTDPLTKPTGIAVGDILIASCLGDAASAAYGAAITSSGGTWLNIAADTWAGSGYKSQICWKVCTAGDLAGAWYADLAMVFNANIRIQAYRGGSQVAARASQLSNATLQTTLVLPGIIPSPDSRKIVSLASDRDTASLLTPPAGFTSRQHSALGAFLVAAADIDPRDYIDNAAATWTDTFASPGYWETGYLLEIT